MDDEDRSYKFHASYSDPELVDQLVEQYGVDWEFDNRGADFKTVPMGEDEIRAMRKARDLAVELDTNVYLNEERKLDDGRWAYRLVNIYRKPEPE